MPRLIFDIETVGVNFDTLDAKSQEYLIKGARNPEEAEKVQDNLSFSPLTGQIVAIGILNPDTDRGAVYFQAPPPEAFPLIANRGGGLQAGQASSKLEKQTDEDGVQYIPLSEKDILKEFWDLMRHYDQFITFNGRSFDCPFIMVRSAVLKVKPSMNLMPNRYYDQHIDLYDRLGFFGAVRRTMSLHMWCQAFGIKSSKTGEVTGEDVGKHFKEGRYLDIAKYCFDDLRATKELFEYWEKYINIK